MKNIKKSVYFPVLIIFLALMSIVLISFFTNETSVSREKEEALRLGAENVEEKIRERFVLFEEKLRTGVGLFLVEDSVSRAEWDAFINSSGAGVRFPGTQAVGYAKLVNESNLQEFERIGRKEYKADFAVYPEASNGREVYAVITVSQPDNDRNNSAIGFDMYSNDERRATMETVRDTGDTKITDTVNLVQEDPEDAQPGFLMYTPHYSVNAENLSTEERIRNIEGYVYAVFRSRTFLGSIFIDREPEEVVDFKISAGENFSDELYVTSEYDEYSTGFMESYVDFLGATWKIDYTYNPDSLVPSRTNDRPQNILYFGTFSALLISTIIYLLLRGKAGQLLLEQERYVNDAKDNLLSIASHQLRTPATGVKQYIGMMLQGFSGDLSAKQTSLLQKAYSSNERQLKTINDILYLAKIDSGRMMLSKKRFNVKKVVNSVVEELSDEIDKNDLRVKTLLPKNAVYLQADEHMVRMIIENLLTNAIKYTKPKGKIEVQLKSKNGKVQIAVKDNGIGIAKSNHGRIFEQFTRIDNELSKTVSGTGVGLYLTKHLVNLHGGTIQVISELGKGSEFIVVLPKR